MNRQIFPLGAACAVLAYQSACSDPDLIVEDTVTGRDTLVDPDMWIVTPPDQDPRPTHRPELQSNCQEGAWSREAGGIEIDTGVCPYVSLSQPTTRNIDAGSSLRIQAWWQTLAATKPTNGHIALFLDGEVLWEDEVPIPGAADTRDEIITSARTYPPGSTVTFHLHNHGYNTWTLGRFGLFNTP